MYCPRCGSQVGDEAASCPMCEYIFPAEIVKPAATVGAPPLVPSPPVNDLGFQTVTTTPIPYGPGAIGPAPNALPWAILVSLCCCNVLGLVAVIFAAQSGAKWHAGDYDGAREAHRQAMVFTWVGFVLGFVPLLGYAVLMAISVISGEF